MRKYNFSIPLSIILLKIIFESSKFEIPLYKSYKVINCRFIAQYIHISTILCGFSKVSSGRATMTIVRVGRCNKIDSASNLRLHGVFNFCQLVSVKYPAKQRAESRGMGARKWKTLPSRCRGLGKRGCALLVRKSRRTHLTFFLISWIRSSISLLRRSLYIFYRILRKNLPLNPLKKKE